MPRMHGVGEQHGEQGELCQPDHDLVMRLHIDEAHDPRPGQNPTARNNTAVDGRERRASALTSTPAIKVAANASRRPM